LKLPKDVQGVVSVETDFGGIPKSQLLSQLAPKKGHRFGQFLLDLCLNHSILICVYHLDVLTLGTLLQLGPKHGNIYIWFLFHSPLHNLLLELIDFILSQLAFHII
jgi:hypothetical protein